MAKIFAFDEKVALLLGIGNGFCGSSAIGATEHIIGVEKKDAGLSIAVVNFLGTVGMFLLPIVGTLFLKFDHLNSGLLIGNTLQAVGNVAAAGFSVSPLSGQTAMIVKMARILITYIAIISTVSHYALVLAMAGIGLKTTIASIVKDGKSALLIGSLSFFVQIVFSSGAIFLFMQ